MAKETLIRTLDFTTAAQAQRYIQIQRAAYRRNDENGFPLYRTPASLVLRLKPSGQGAKIDVLSNCVC